MLLEKIAEASQHLEVRLYKRISDHYHERIIYTRDVEKWSGVLSDILGPPAKPAGVEPSLEDLNLTKPYGSIFKHQTLFKKTSAGGETVIAMFWPWMDEKHITLKIAQMKK